MFGFAPGVIGSGKFDIEDHFIVVSNVQTLIKFLPQCTKEFGTVVVDECHHISSTTFTNVVSGLAARYRVGLSGTLARRDGKHVLFSDVFGSVVHKPPKSNVIDPKVIQVKTGVMLTPGAHWSKKINDLLYDKDYQDFIVNIARQKIKQGHRVLIPADRVEFLENVAEQLGKDTCVLITGSTETKDQAVRQAMLQEVSDGKKMCIAATRQIFTEGLSVNILSCVILAVPTGNHIILEQLIARIMRKHAIKESLQPEVIDLVFAGYESRKQNDSRLAFYLEQGWDIKQV